MNQSRNPQRTVLIASFCLGIALGIFRLIVDLAYLEPEVELYRRGSVPPVILKVLLGVCVVLALLTVFVVRKKDQGLTLNNSGTVLSFLALLLALLILAYVVVLFVTQLKSGFSTIRPLFGQSDGSSSTAPADSLSVLLLFVVSFPVAAYYLVCFFGKKKNELRAGLSVFPILFYILIVIHSYFDSSAALNSDPKVMLLLSLIGCLLFSVEEARAVIEIPRKRTLLAFSCLFMICAIPQGVSSLVLNLSGTLSSECGLILPCIMIVYPLYAFFSLIRPAPKAEAASAESQKPASNP
ncbi:MAG: hypothetical protein II719_04615 [Clostridia bacterium]|nr:hypothetical protein [Clostridia bacterium]